jgi:hypothetical protein
MANIDEKDLQAVIKGFNDQTRAIEEQLTHFSNLRLEELTNELQNIYLRKVSQIGDTDLKELVSQWLFENYQNKIEITVSEKATYTADLDGKHSAFKDAMLLVTAFQKLRMVGPAGSGKSTLAEQVAQTLGLRFFKVACNPDIEKTDFVGYLDKDNNHVGTSFTNAYKHGGVLFLDEIDRLNPGAAVALNTILDSSDAFYENFLEEPIARHPDFIVIAAANTWGRGSVEYTAAEYQDMAFLDRWRLQTIVVGYDPTLEKAICSDDATYNVMMSIRDVMDTHGSYFSTRNLSDLLVLSKQMGSMRNAFERMIQDMDDKETVMKSVDFSGVTTDVDISNYLES